MTYDGTIPLRPFDGVTMIRSPLARSDELQARAAALRQQRLHLEERRSIIQGTKWSCVFRVLF
jgi:hypothetical protein